MKSNNGYTVRAVADGLSSTFHQYLRAQYHIWDESLIRERDRLFERPGTTHQEPYIETTPIYRAGKLYANLSIPDAARNVLELASTSVPETGIPKVPYYHQAEAIELHLGKEHDLVAATGTGSGKTETFLMPVIGRLAIESASRPKSWQMPGVRALILYPMNALVNDQVARLRKLMGNGHVMSALRGARSRNATFGMYTSRTPYAGLPTKEKDKKRLGETLRKLYLEDITSEAKEMLSKEGKWPAKDIRAFIDSGYATGPNDAELLTRHEMQTTAPDVLVTNYSMLEYMMLRPIEASIFEQTKAWLDVDSNNVFTVVLDEAHMYRGSAGAEVAYLLRRLHARLGVDRDRVRYVLTSASFGSGKDAENQTLEFARKLTGGQCQSGFQLITGKLEERPAGAQSSAVIRMALASVVPIEVQNASLDLHSATLQVTQFAAAVGHPTNSSIDNIEMLRAEVYRLLYKLPVAHLVAQEVTSRPLAFRELTSLGFGDHPDSVAASEALLALMAFAREEGSGRSFASLRSHLFFRGLPGLYACSNRACDMAVGSYSERMLGVLHERPTFQCGCGSRVYELLTHRDCGAAYLRGYISENNDFLWHEPSKRTWSEMALTEVHAFILREEDVGSTEGCIRWLHSPTGRILNTRPTSGDRGEFLPLVWGTKWIVQRGQRMLSVEPECPSCKRDLSDDPKIMDLATKGEAPFSHLIKTQVALQPASLPISKKSPNAGRKSLLFSDGRQKAARLARDIPREIELDVFRQLLFLAVSHLQEAKLEPTLDSKIYLGFLMAVTESAVSLFDGGDRAKLAADAEEFSTFYEGNYSDALTAFEPPNAFNVSLLRQLCSSFYSISALTLGRLEPTRLALRRLSEALSGTESADLLRIAVPWIHRMLSKYAFDRNISRGVRRQAWPYAVSVSSPMEGFTPRQKAYLEKRGFDVEAVSKALASALCDPSSDDGFFISPSKVKLQPAFANEWAQCESCKSILPVDWWSACAHCLSQSVTWISPANSSYLRARKGFWHDPVVAALEGKDRPINLAVEEHTAQLSYKDADNSATTTEEFERRFRDILIHKTDTSIDVLSSTTTMEVGIDIGSLIAVGMRNVPPMRQNYQQRAGRAGRRGSSVSSVITYAQNGAHDVHYFLHPQGIISGNPPKPILDTSNEHIIVRHVRAQLVQDFFGPRAEIGQSGDLFSVLGGTRAFYNDKSRTSLDAFREWVQDSKEAMESMERAKSWLPSNFKIDVESIARSFIEKLESIRPIDCDLAEDGLLDHMFSKGLLPSYAFPKDLCALHIEHRDSRAFPPIVIDERPQQSLSVALSEYAPGKQLVVNKKTYRVGTVAARAPFTEVNRAHALFESSKKYIHCSECLYTAGFTTNEASGTECPQCNNESLKYVTVITPEVVYPINGREVDEYDDEHTYSRASAAQLPLPDASRPLKSEPFGATGEIAFERSQDLIMVNRGPEDEESEDGFDVCSDCGKVLLDGESAKTHNRDYLVQGVSGIAPPARCNGAFERVYLGYGFVSDVLVLRFEIRDPLRFDLVHPRNRRPLEDALTSLADALVLAMSRVMDIDVREINAGHRFAVVGDKTFADIFMYDTLSGGAGYAYQAGLSFRKIFAEAIDILRDCTCDTSCEQCLRHYGNRFNHNVHDRKLALDVARYIMEGVVPGQMSPEETKQTLTPLAKLLELAGWNVNFDSSGNFLGAHDGRRLHIEAVPSLRMPPDRAADGTIVHFSRYELTRDLSSAYAEIA